MATCDGNGYRECSYLWHVSLVQLRFPFSHCPFLLHDSQLLVVKITGSKLMNVSLLFFSFLAHNGEINTLKGNINNMRAREGMMSCKYYKENLQK